MAACADKGKHGLPISPPKLGERIVTSLLFTPQIGGRKNQTPTGGYKFTRFACTRVAVLPVHDSTLWLSRLQTSIKRLLRCVAKALLCIIATEADITCT